QGLRQAPCEWRARSSGQGAASASCGNLFFFCARGAKAFCCRIANARGFFQGDEAAMLPGGAWLREIGAVMAAPAFLARIGGCDDELCCRGTVTEQARRSRRALQPLNFRKRMGKPVPVALHARIDGHGLAKLLHE